MKTTCTLTITCNTTTQANDIAQALTIDDQHYIHTTTQNNILTADIQTDNIKSLIQTLDDYLACLDVALSIATSDKN